MPVEKHERTLKSKAFPVNEAKSRRVTNVTSLSQRQGSKERASKRSQLSHTSGLVLLLVSCRNNSQPILWMGSGDIRMAHACILSSSWYFHLKDKSAGPQAPRTIFLVFCSKETWLQEEMAHTKWVCRGKWALSNAQGSRRVRFALGKLLLTCLHHHVVPGTWLCLGSLNHGLGVFLSQWH